MSSKKTKTLKPETEKYTLKNSIANVYLTVAFAVFPFFVNFVLNGSFPFLHFDEGFYSIRHQKYYFFLVITAAAVIAEIMLLFTRTAEDKKAANPNGESLLKRLSFTDWAMLGFVFVNAVSTVFSPYIEMAFFGEITTDGYSHGRNNGLILMLFYAAVYFMLTRCFKYREYVFTALAAVNGIIYLLAVLNGFHIDPLNMFEAFLNDETIYNNFMTTIGNKNMFSSHLCVTLPVIIAMFVYSRTLWRKIIYLASACIGAMAFVVCDSDSAVLGLGAFFAVFIVIFSRRPGRLCKLLSALTAMLCSIKLLRFFSYLGGDKYKELSAVPSKIMLSNGTFIAIAVLAAITAGLYFFNRKFPEKKFNKAVPIVIGSVFALSVLGGLAVVFWFSVIDTKTKLGSLSKTIRFNDAWGTHRGIMWNRALQTYGKDYNFFQKLFGSGPETFYYTFSPYFDELYKRFGDTSTDAAHNEYINYLMNVGLLGLLSYLAFAGGALVRGFKAAKKEPLALVFIAAVVGYMAQAVVNIALPIATPLFIIFVALSEAVARKALKK